MRWTRLLPIAGAIAAEIHGSRGQGLASCIQTSRCQQLDAKQRLGSALLQLKTAIEPQIAHFPGTIFESTETIACLQIRQEANSTYCAKFVNTRGKLDDVSGNLTSILGISQCYNCGIVRLQGNSQFVVDAMPSSAVGNNCIEVVHANPTLDVETVYLCTKGFYWPRGCSADKDNCTISQHTWETPTARSPSKDLQLVSQNFFNTIISDTNLVTYNDTSLRPDSTLKVYNVSVPGIRHAQLLLPANYSASGSDFRLALNFLALKCNASNQGYEGVLYTEGGAIDMYSISINGTQ